MAIVLYNSLTRSKETFEARSPDAPVLFYNCGPTVYGPFHIGNARNFVVMDVVRRWLLHRGFRVRYVQNITDVDDKIITRAQKEGMTPEALAEKYTALFHEHIGWLGNLPADEYPRATQHIRGMIEDIGAMIERGHAYATPDGSVWFDVRTFPEYGRLSRLPLDQMMEGGRVASDQQRLKRSTLDFALWKGAKPGEPAWDAPWGAGRPGWHIECSVMASRCLGDTIDIHSGGMDLRFPHHENEIAQSECLGRRPFARFWLHNGFLDIEGEKMSKSLGNFITMDKALESTDALTLRLFLVSAHYRDPHDFSEDSMNKARSGARRIADADAEAGAVLAKHGASPASTWSDDAVLAAHEDEFGVAMDDDINTARALGALFQVVTIVNTRRVAAEREGAPAIAGLASATGLLRSMRGVLGLTPALEKKQADLGGDGLVEDLVRVLIEARAEARKARQYAIGDMIRTRLGELGITLEDKPTETVWKLTRKD